MIEHWRDGDGQDQRVTTPGSVGHTIWRASTPQLKAPLRQAAVGRCAQSPNTAALASQRVSPANALEAVTEDTGETVPGGMIRVAGTDHFGGLDRSFRRNPDDVDRVELEGGFAPSLEHPAPGGRRPKACLLARRQRSWPYRNVKKTFGVDSHFGPPAIHTKPPSHRRARRLRTARSWPVPRRPGCRGARCARPSHAQAVQPNGGRGLRAVPERANDTGVRCALRASGDAHRGYRASGGAATSCGSAAPPSVAHWPRRRGWERPPSPRAWYGFGGRCVCAPLSPTLRVAPRPAIPTREGGSSAPSTRRSTRSPTGRS